MPPSVHTTNAAGMHTAPANAQPSRRSGMADAVAGSDTGSTKVRRTAVDPVTARGLTMPANRTTNPTTAMATTDRAAWVEHTVATVMRTALATHSPR